MQEPSYVPQADITSIIEFLDSVGNSRCPWCGSSNWDIITESDSKVTTPVLESPDTIEIYNERREQVKNARVTINKTDKNPGVSMKLRCNCCGCELRFDYFYVLKRIKQIADNKA